MEPRNSEVIFLLLREMAIDQPMESFVVQLVWRP